MRIFGYQVELLLFLWGLVGAALGALAIAIVSRLRSVRAQREHTFALRKREGALDRLKARQEEQEERLRRQEEQLAELGAVRTERQALAAELEQARRTVADLQLTLETTRSNSRETELRLGAQLDAERQESAGRRAAADAELAATREATAMLRAELQSARDAAVRTQGRLETDLDSTRAMLQRLSDELREERRVASEMREQLRTRLRQVEEEGQRLEGEIAAERRRAADKVASVQSFIATLREQYALAAAERDAVTREASAQRDRADDARHALDHARAEFARALEEEHRSAMELLARAWTFIHDYPRMPDWWPRVAGTGAEPPDAARLETEAPIEVEREPDVAPPPASESARVPDYDIEAELADAIALDLERRPGSGRRVARKPIGTIVHDDEKVVICDDGSAWAKRDNGWQQVAPVPGTPGDATGRISQPVEQTD